MSRNPDRRNNNNNNPATGYAFSTPHIAQVSSDSLPPSSDSQHTLANTTSYDPSPPSQAYPHSRLAAINTRSNNPFSDRNSEIPTSRSDSPSNPLLASRDSPTRSFEMPVEASRSYAGMPPRGDGQQPLMGGQSRDYRQVSVDESTSSVSLRASPCSAFSLLSLLLCAELRITCEVHHAPRSIPLTP
ncbi:hypothetical protein IAR55_002642 [Kwoniella newhampshirensis]|uniref:Uncharacterized protein n=1 Tax=Kwoniella newhampshirensis TaxID=1651941 RepID=A0AAW0Z1E7_9TREE